MQLVAGTVYKNAESNLNAQPVLFRNPNGADLLVGLKEVIGSEPTSTSQLDNIGHLDDELYSIVDMLKSCDYIAVTANATIIGLNLKAL